MSRDITQRGAEDDLLSVGDAGALDSLAFPALSHPALTRRLGLNGLRTMLSLVSESLPTEISDEASEVPEHALQQLAELLNRQLPRIVEQLESRIADRDASSRYVAAARASTDWLEQASASGGSATAVYEKHAEQIGKEFIDGRSGRFGGPPTPTSRRERPERRDDKPGLV